MSENIIFDSAPIYTKTYPKLSQNYTKLPNFDTIFKSSENLQINMKQFLINKMDNKKRTNFWNQKQLSSLFQLYNQFGPQWSKIAMNFDEKNQHIIKNKFNSALRKFVHVLCLSEKKNLKRSSKQLNFRELNNILEFSYQAKRQIQKNQLKINYDSLIFRVRSQIIRLCSKTDLHQNQQIFNLTVNLRTVNKFLRCFEIMKRNNLKGWYISIDNLISYNQKDQIYFETINRQAINQIRCQKSRNRKQTNSKLQDTYNYSQKQHNQDAQQKIITSNEKENSQVNLFDV